MDVFLHPPQPVIFSPLLCFFFAAKTISEDGDNQLLLQHRKDELRTKQEAYRFVDRDSRAKERREWGIFAKHLENPSASAEEGEKRTR